MAVINTPLLSAQAPSCWLNMVTPCMSSQHLATTSFIGHFQSCTMIPQIPAAGEGGTPPLRLLGTPCHWRVMPVVAMEVISNPTTWHRPLPSGVIRMDLVVSQFPIDMVKYEYQQAEKSSIDHQNTPNQSTEPRDLLHKGVKIHLWLGVGSCQIHNISQCSHIPQKKICTPTTSEYFPCFYTLPMAEPKDGLGRCFSRYHAQRQGTGRTANLSETAKSAGT